MVECIEDETSDEIFDLIGIWLSGDSIFGVSILLSEDDVGTKSRRGERM